VSSQAAQAPDVFALECLISTTKTSCYLLGHAAGTAYDRHLYIGSSGRLILGVYDSANRVVIGSSVVSDGKTHHVVGRVAAGGVLSVWVDGSKQGEATFGPTFFAYSPKISLGSAAFNMSGWPEASADLMPFVGMMDEPAVYRGALSDAAIVRHAQVALRPSRLAGRATLDNGSPASRVLARNWDTDQPAGAATPGADGSWQIYVAPGNYEVSVRGPAGYQPVTHGPVAAVSDV
jgi:hypothetical protein